MDVQELHERSKSEIPVVGPCAASSPIQPAPQSEAPDDPTSLPEARGSYVTTVEGPAARFRWMQTNAVRCIPPFSAMSRNRDLHDQTRMFRSCVCAPLQATGDVMVVCVTPLVMRVESAEASSHATNPKQLALLSASLVGRGVVSALKQLQLISCSELTTMWAPLLQVVGRGRFPCRRHPLGGDLDRGLGLPRGHGGELTMEIVLRAGGR